MGPSPRLGPFSIFLTGLIANRPAQAASHAQNPRSLSAPTNPTLHGLLPQGLPSMRAYQAVTQLLPHAEVTPSCQPRLLASHPPPSTYQFACAPDRHQLIASPFPTQWSHSKAPDDQALLQLPPDRSPHQHGRYPCCSASATVDLELHSTPPTSIPACLSPPMQTRKQHQLPAISAAACTAPCTRKRA